MLANNNRPLNNLIRSVAWHGLWLQIIVEVSYPTAIGIVPGLPVELEVGSYIPAAVGLRDTSGESDSNLLCF
jgi:hypothetical protein